MQQPLIKMQTEKYKDKQIEAGKWRPEKRKNRKEGGETKYKTNVKKKHEYKKEKR